MPEYIFEASWEVCNMMGGIYTVLSTKAATLQQQHGNNLVFIGPDVWTNSESPYFEEDRSLFAQWKTFTEETCNLPVRTGRWKIPGRPIAVLVNFEALWEQQNRIYEDMWLHFGANSIAAYGDYDECAMFGYAAGMIIESFCKFFQISTKAKIIAHFNEWQTSFGVFYVKKFLPNIATVFTTHATTVGRSIAGNHKPLYNYLEEYNGDQMAQELNIVSKHSVEKIAAHIADCFTTVSQITARECACLLGKQPFVTPNGFENNFVPPKNIFNKKRKEARECLRRVSEKLLGYSLPENTLFVSTAGRYEYKNKGIDTFIEAVKRIADNQMLTSQVVAFIMVPAHIRGARADLATALEQPQKPFCSWNRFTTHELHDYDSDNVMNALRWFRLNNQENEQIKVIFVPSYLNGADGIFNKAYYDLLIGMDLTVFPSYYEPWGYTPLESIAFAIPTITTDLSGFGQWAANATQSIENGVGVIHRNDYNNYEVASELAKMIETFVCFSDNKIAQTRKKASEIAEKALWKHFIEFYEKAYEKALNNVK
ncbi:MAG: glycogen/starch synthase [Prevotellaceae bacterium]|jgi:glycosyltransferase involved in cell wall biosynthesis|nr:glycogen/starch synthase [Prevotellaceae bacterium]